MKITVTLARAHKIAERIKTLRQNAAAVCQRQCGGVSVSLGRHNIERRAEQAKSDFDLNLLHYLSAAEAYTVVRKAIDAGNRQGVSDLMAEREQVRAMLQNMRNWVTTSSMCALDIVDVSSVPDESQGMAFNAATVRLLDLSDIKNRIKDLEKKESRLSDEIADLNAIKISFEISDAVSTELGLNTD